MSKFSKLTVFFLLLSISIPLPARYLGSANFNARARLIKTAYLRVNRRMAVIIDPGYDDLDIEIRTSKARVRSFCNSKSGHIVKLTAENGYHDGKDFILQEQTGEKSHIMKFYMESNKDPRGNRIGSEWYNFYYGDNIIETQEGDGRYQGRRIRAVIYPGEAKNKPYGDYLAKMILSQYTVE